MAQHGASSVPLDWTCHQTSLATSPASSRNNKFIFEGSSNTCRSGCNDGISSAASLCPSIPFPTCAGQEKEQNLARMALGTCNYKQGDARWAGRAWRDHPTLPLAFNEVTQSGWRQGWSGRVSQFLPLSQLWHGRVLLSSLAST